MKRTKMLKKNYEFKAVLTKGTFFKKNQIEVFILKNNKKRNFLGIAIGTKNGKAFQRNRVKRIIRECYAKIESEILEGYSVVILMNKRYPIENITFSGVLEELQNIFEIANISSKKEEKI